MIIDPETYIDSLEENLIRGRGSWIATFTDFYRNYNLRGRKFLLYAEGSTYVKGFLLSRIFSFFINPRRKVYFLVTHTNQVTDNYLRELIRLCNGLGEEDDYVLLVILTNEGDIKGSIKKKITSLKEGKVGIFIHSLTSNKKINSDNFLGRSLKKLIGEGIELSAIHGGDVAKAISIMLILSLLILLALHVIGAIVLDTITILIDVLFSMILGYILYRRIYHTSFRFNIDGFTIKKGRWRFTDKWINYKKIWLHVEGHEECIRLKGDEGYIDIPIKRINVDRYALMNFIKRRLRVS